MKPLASHVRGERPTVDLYAQPEVRNPDGSTSTVDSIGVNLDGKEYLLPTVTPDGRHFVNEVVRRGERDVGAAVARMAVDEFRRTGRHLGVYSTPTGSTLAAQRIHRDYERGRYRTRPMASHGTLRDITEARQ